MTIDFRKGLSIEELKSPVKNYLHPVDTVFSIHDTVGKAMAQLRQKKIRNTANYFYGVDEKGCLRGIASARSLLFADPNTPIVDVMSTTVIKIHEEIKLKEALNLLADKQLLALPVVDAEERLQGIVEVPPVDFSKLASQEQALHNKVDQDIFQMIGFTLEQAKVQSSIAEFKYRMPWLLCNIVGGLLCAGIAGFFAATLSEVIVLALFIPLVLSLCESISMQSMTLSLQFMHQKKVHVGQFLKRIILETKSGVLLGLTSAVLVCLVFIFFSSDLKPLAPIGISIFISMIASALLGTFVPVAFHALRLDPKVAAGPIVLTVADMMTTTIYLSLATYWLLA